MTILYNVFISINGTAGGYYEKIYLPESNSTDFYCFILLNFVYGECASCKLELEQSGKPNQREF